MIEFIVICSLAFYGFKVSQGEGMIFYKTAKKLDAWFEEKGFVSKISYKNDIYKRSAFVRFFQYPLYACPKCMPSIWGSAAYWIKYYNSPDPIQQVVLTWLLSILAMIGIVNVLMYQFPFEDD